MYVAFGFAAVFGLAFFAIWWLTEADDPRPAASAVQEAPAPATGAGASSPSLDAPVLALPRGGSLTGSTGTTSSATTDATTNATEDAIARLTHAPLVRINRSTDAVEPWLAELWTASPDNLTYTLKLRPGILWSDGTPLTAEDGVASLAAVQVPALGTPLKVRALDPLTIEVVFPQPFAPGLRILDRHPVLPRHAPPDRVGLGPFVAEAPGPAGTGPRAGPRTFARNPHYWRKAPDGSALPYLDELTLAPGAPGQHDFGDAAIRPDDYEALKKLEVSGKARLFELGPGLDADALWFSPAPPGAIDKPWLTSETLRLAISAAVDRRDYCKQIWFGACDPMAGPVSPANVAWFNPDLPLGRGNPDLARRMLADLGLLDRSQDGALEDATGRSVRFSLLIRRGVASSARAAAFLEATLRGVGVGVDVTELDAPALLARRTKGSYDAIYDRIEVDDTDPAMNLDFWLSSGSAHVWNPARPPGAAGAGPFDWERQIDQLMLKHAAVFNRAERLQAFAEVQRIYSRHMPALFFGTPHVRVLTAPRVLNATPSPLRPHLLWSAETLAALK